MQAISDVKVGHPARLSEDDRLTLEAMRGRANKTQWEIANFVWGLHDAYNFGDHDPNTVWPRSEIADACGVLPKEVDSMVSTVEHVGWLAETSGLDVCYNAWKYIARHEDPQDFLSHLLRSMDDYGGKFPPVSVIRMKLADSKGNPPPPKPREWKGGVMGELYDVVGGDFCYKVYFTKEQDFEPNMRVTLIEERTGTAPDGAGRTEAGA